MSRARNSVLLMLLALNLTSCVVSDYTRKLQVEIMKPAVINIPQNTNSVAIINLNSRNRIPSAFQYFDGFGNKTDSIIQYKALSDTCVNALESFLKKDGYFKEVINYHDSLADSFTSDRIIMNPEEMFQKTKSDICIFLDLFKFDVAAPFGFGDVVTNKAALSWKIAIKTDSLAYLYNQMDTLIYDSFDFPMSIGVQKKLHIIVNNSSNYLGKFFGGKIVPTWLPVERLYYKSNNQKMLLAEKYALKSDWLKAAEIWNVQTKNKNARIAAKACYNMALACEMEGKPDVAIDWLVRSHESLIPNGEGHKANCQRYVAVLAQRKKEIVKLEKQVRNN